MNDLRFALRDADEKTGLNLVASVEQESIHDIQSSLTRRGLTRSYGPGFEKPGSIQFTATQC